MLACGVKVLPMFILLKKSMDYVCLDKLYLVKVNASSFQINKPVDPKFILISHFKNNANINWNVFK